MWGSTLAHALKAKIAGRHNTAFEMSVHTVTSTVYKLQIAAGTMIMFFSGPKQQFMLEQQAA